MAKDLALSSVGDAYPSSAEGSWRWGGEYHGKGLWGEHLELEDTVIPMLTSLSLSLKMSVQ